MATKVIMLIRTPEARAEIQSINGKKLIKTETAITATAIMTKSCTSMLSIVNLRHFIGLAHSAYQVKFGKAR
jgi:hypothetical protein